ncbi:MAG: deoxyribose-phosphate aldolase [Kiritimatiellae bacterium]|nr:deoxyribose-phosphate aldolase [Kiritimatiellia bacterium]
MIGKQEFARMQDHSILEPDADQAAVDRRIDECLEHGFAAVYVNPCYVRHAAARLEGSTTAVGTVIGFPHGANKTEIKIQEALHALEDGASELDVVINISRLKSGDDAYVRDELERFVQAVKARHAAARVKVIIETCYLTRAEKMRACEIVANSGADYIKTSTGTGPAGCRIGDIRLMRRVCGERVKIKAAAQITFLEQALAIIEAGAERIGENTAVAMLGEWEDMHGARSEKARATSG